jgi:hypothetical protein
MKRLYLPDRVRGRFFDAVWGTGKIWSLPTEATSLPLDELAWHLDLTVWSTQPGVPLFDLAPREVLSAPSDHPRHWARVIAADVSWPLEMFRRDDRWVIIDGYHRLVRHCSNGSPIVPVRLHPDSAWAAIEAS